MAGAGGGAAAGGGAGGGGGAGVTTLAGATGGGVRRSTLCCRASASCSSCSRNCRAMARARPTQRPMVRASRGSFSGPSTTSAIPKITNISEKSIPNIACGEPACGEPKLPRSDARRGLVVAVLCGLVWGHLGELGVLGGRGRNLLGWLLGLPLVHRLLEAAEGRAQVGSQGLDLLAAEDQQYDQQYEQQVLGGKQVHGALRSSLEARRRPVINDRSFGAVQLTGGPGYSWARF